jgi:microcystin-dependent protein
VTSSIQTQIDSKTRLPTGTIIMSVAETLQDFNQYLWLKCDGRAVSRTVYADLYDYIRTRYGAGDGSTTFNVPNFQACFMRGAMFNQATERVVNGVTYTPNSPLTIQQDSLEEHEHDSGLGGNYLQSGTSTNVGYSQGFIKPNQSDFPAYTGGVTSTNRSSVETRPLNHSVYFYITC